MASGDNIFRFKEFSVIQQKSAMKIGTDGVLLGAWASGGKPLNILDVGAGTGIISLMLAQRFQDAVITGIEVDADAAVECRNNFETSEWSSRLNVVNTDFAFFDSADIKFDLIVSNPPFFANGIKAPDSGRALARHSSENLSPEKLLEKGVSLLSGNGCISMIVPAEYEENLIFKATLLKFSVSRITRVASKEGKPPVRILIEFTNLPKGAPVISSLSIRGIGNCFSEEYVNLTKDFYINF